MFFFLLLIILLLFYYYELSHLHQQDREKGVVKD